MSEWTPTDDEAVSMFITGWCCDTNPETAHTMPDGAWSRWLAAHDQALREQVARDIEARREHFIAETTLTLGGLPAWADEYLNGMNDAIDVARGEDQTDE